MKRVKLAVGLLLAGGIVVAAVSTLRLPADEPIFERIGDIQDCPECPQMVVLGEGQVFVGGSEKTDKGPPLTRGEKWPRVSPRYWAKITKPFAVGKFLVTREQYDEFVRATGHPVTQNCHGGYAMDWSFLGDVDEEKRKAHRKKRTEELLAQGVDFDPRPKHMDYNHNDMQRELPLDGNHPVTCIAHSDATAYIAWFNATKKPKDVPDYRLLNEIEWEYAARAGTKDGRYFWGNDPTLACKYGNTGDETKGKVLPSAFDAPIKCDDGYLFTSPIDAFPPNPAGLYDISGNLFEYLQGPWMQRMNAIWPQGSAAPTKEECEAIPSCDWTRTPGRGGAWYRSDWKMAIRHRSRNRKISGTQPRTAPWIGFRIGRDATPKEIERSKE